jgi:hypothetical protein
MTTSLPRVRQPSQTRVIAFGHDAKIGFFDRLRAKGEQTELHKPMVGLACRFEYRAKCRGRCREDRKQPGLDDGIESLIRLADRQQRANQGLHFRLIEIAEAIADEIMHQQRDVASICALGLLRQFRKPFIDHADGEPPALDIDRRALMFSAKQRR